MIDGDELARTDDDTDGGGGGATAAPAAPRRAGTLAAIGTVAAIALVVAGGTVAWARYGGGQATTEAAVGLQEELPAALADGRPPGPVPAGVAAAVEAPVVGVAVLEELPAGLADCGGDVDWDEAPQLEFGVVTPDGAQVSVVGRSEDFHGADMGAPVPEPDGTPAPEAPRVRATCHFRWDGEGWASSDMSMVDLADAGGMGGMSWSSDGSGFATAQAMIAVPEGAGWMVQDRGGYRLAYPVAGLATVPLTLRFREGPFRPGPPAVPLTFVDDDGGIIDEILHR